MLDIGDEAIYVLIPEQVKVIKENVMPFAGMFLHCQKFWTAFK